MSARTLLKRIIISIFKNTFTLFPTLALPRSGQGSNINSSQPKAPLNMTVNIIRPFCYYCKKKGENPLNLINLIHRLKHPCHQFYELDGLKEDHIPQVASFQAYHM